MNAELPLEAEEVIVAMSRVMAACLRNERSRRRFTQTDPAPGAEPSSAPGTASGSETAETAAQVWQEYTVQKGDSLSKISERYYGTMSRVKDICELNQIAVEDLIYAGQKIYLPK